uniref:Kinesin family member 28 n=1 Tax=Nannospalax galili TaxID=1026970 RepID=A0A8C6W6S2_NANGA
MHSKSTTTIQDPKNAERVKTFTFDRAYWSHDGFQEDKDGVLIPSDPARRFAGQNDVFRDIGRGILDSRYNATLLAYGQTGSGKSYSMIGFGTNKGIIPRVCEELFHAVEDQEKNQECQVTFSMLEIYNEQIRDLLSRTKSPGGLKVREDQQLGFFVEGLKSVPCENYAQIEKLMEQGTKIRTTATTNMNVSSSRSHMVITIQFKQVRVLTCGKGFRLAMGKKSALGGNSRTTLVRSSTQLFLFLAKKVRNKAVVNTCTLVRESRAENTLLLRCGNTGVAGSRDIGQAASNAVTLQGLGISDKHASFTNVDGKVTVAPYSKCKVVVNGVPITTSTKLQHLDRIILGSNSAYLYVGFPSERGGEDLSKFDYDFFQLELAAAEGVSVDMLGPVSRGDGRANPSVLAVFQDYIKLMPLVAEANQMSEELEKGLKMELKVKNLASSDSRGYDLQKEVMVKVTKQRTHEVRPQQCGKKFLMEELYQRFLEGEDSHVTQDDDPFWDPVEVVHLGSAHIWLQSLAYCMKLEEQVEFLNCEGLEEAMLHIHIVPCSPEGRAHDEEEVVIDPLELRGKRIDFQIHIVQCLGVKWLKEDARQGVQMGYKIYDLPKTLYTKAVWKSVNPQIEETEFLDYLQTNALIVDLWGLQAQKPSDNPKKTGMTAQLQISQMCTQQASCDRELARALKVFYQGMNAARGQLLRLRQYRPPEDDEMLRPFIHQQSQMLKDVGELLDSSLWKLKNDVALIVRKKKEYILHTKQ